LRIEGAVLDHVHGLLGLALDLLDQRRDRGRGLLGVLGQLPDRGHPVVGQRRHQGRTDDNPVGEVRDLETADIALEAALTGHLDFPHSTRMTLSVRCRG